MFKFISLHCTPQNTPAEKELSSLQYYDDNDSIPQLVICWDFIIAHIFLWCKSSSTNYNPNGPHVAADQLQLRSIGSGHRQLNLWNQLTNCVFQLCHSNKWFQSRKKYLNYPRPNLGKNFRFVAGMENQKRKQPPPQLFRRWKWKIKLCRTNSILDDFSSSSLPINHDDDDEVDFSWENKNCRLIDNETRVGQMKIGGGFDLVFTIDPDCQMHLLCSFGTFYWFPDRKPIIPGNILRPERLGH